MTWKRLFPGYTKQLIFNELERGAQFDELKFPLRALQNYKVIQFRSALESETAGLGTSMNLKDAYKIAYFEYLERKALFDFGVHHGFDSTNGIALHKFQFLASAAARSELFERDSFLLHWHSRTPFISIALKGVSERICTAVTEIKGLGFETRFGRTFLGEQEAIVSTLIDMNTGGFALGLSSGRGTAKDIEKAFLEACVNLFFGDCGKSKDELINQVKAEGVGSLAGHRTLWLYLKPIPGWFYDTCESTCVYERNTIKLKQILLSMEPYPVVGVYSPDVLKLEVGEASGTTIDLLRRRIRSVIPGEINIWSWPHPIP